MQKKFVHVGKRKELMNALKGGNDGPTQKKKRGSGEDSGRKRHLAKMKLEEIR